MLYHILIGYSYINIRPVFFFFGLILRGYEDMRSNHTSVKNHDLFENENVVSRSYLMSTKSYLLAKERDNFDCFVSVLHSN